MESNEQLELIGNETAPAPVAKNEIEGLHGTSAKHANQHAFRNTVKVAILKAFASVGQATTKEDLTFMINELCTEVLRVWPGIRLEEIGLAIHKTAMGEFEKVYKLSLATFVCGIRAYMNSEGRANAAKEFLKSAPLLMERSRPSDEEIKVMTKQNCLNAYEFYKVNKYFNDYGNSTFQALCDYGGILSFTEEQRNEIWKHARKNVFKYYYLQLSAGNIDRRLEARRIIEELKQHKTHNYLIAEAKKIALNIAFEDMVKANIDLESLIN